jgi:hypothetical protein
MRGMKITASKILYLVALVLFLVAAFNVVSLGSIQFGWLGLVFLAAGLFLA